MRDGEHDALVQQQRHGASDGVPADDVGLDQRALRQYRVEVLQLPALDHPPDDARELAVQGFVRCRAQRAFPAEPSAPRGGRSPAPAGLCM